MNDIMKFENLKDRIIELRGQSVLLDSDVAEIYKVETKRVNEAGKNNPDKYPHDYMFGISEGEFADLRSKFSTAKCDDFVKSRHTGERRYPVLCNTLKYLDSGFHRNDKNWIFRLFTSASKFKHTIKKKKK